MVATYKCVRIRSMIFVRIDGLRPFYHFPCGLQSAPVQRERPVIEFECLGCGSTFEVSDSLAGKVIKCRECHQPGKVQAPFDGVTRTKVGEKLEKPEKSEKSERSSPLSSLSSTLKGSYQCPYCGTRVPWEWRRCWTPASTLLLVICLYVNGYIVLWAYQYYHRVVDKGVGATELSATISSSGSIIWIVIALCVAVIVDVFAFRLVWDWKQVCPRCGIRSG